VTSVFVPVTGVGGLAVPVVEVVDVVPVFDGVVPTARAVLVVGMIVVLGVRCLGALVPMTLVLEVRVSIVEVVDVPCVFHARVPTFGPVSVVVVGMHRAGHRFDPPRVDRNKHRLVPVRAFSLRRPSPDSATNAADTITSLQRVQRALLHSSYLATDVASNADAGRGARPRGRRPPSRSVQRSTNW
jgi:hypothetical protein